MYEQTLRIVHSDIGSRVGQEWDEREGLDAHFQMGSVLLTPTAVEATVIIRNGYNDKGFRFPYTIVVPLEPNHTTEESEFEKLLRPLSPPHYESLGNMFRYAQIPRQEWEELADKILEEVDQSIRKRKEKPKLRLI